MSPLWIKKIIIDLWASKWFKGKKLWWHWRGEGLYNCVHLFSFSSVTGWCQYEILNLKMRLNFLHVSRPAGTTWCTSQSVSWKLQYVPLSIYTVKVLLAFHSVLLLRNAGSCLGTLKSVVWSMIALFDRWLHSRTGENFVTVAKWRMRMMLWIKHINCHWISHMQQGSKELA